MITPDGDRSKKRIWFAKKQLENIKTIDVPAKALKWDGFTFRVWQQGDLSGGRVTAPMGAVVACSSETGVRVSVADYWAGGFTNNSAMHSIYYAADGNDPRIKIFDLPSEEDVILDENSIVTFIPMENWSPFGLIDGAEFHSGTSVWVRDYSSAPGIMPYKGAEGFWFTLNDNVFIDLNSSGIADFPKYIYDTTLLFYSSDGSNLGGRKTVSLQVGGGDPMASDVQPWRIFQQLTSDWQCTHSVSPYEVVEGKFICGQNIQFPTTTSIYLEDMIQLYSLPNDLRTILLNAALPAVSQSLGSYSFASAGEQTFLHAVNVTNTIPWIADSAADAYFTAHPEHEEWKLFLVFSVGATKYVISSAQFIALLDSLATVAVVGSWDGARRMLQQLLPYPNNNFVAPYDSVMFHAHDENIYTWTRQYGAVGFSPLGLAAATLEMPVEVTAEEGVRPDITFAGLVDEEYIYLCVCNKVKEEIKAVYIGSPFISWTALPAPAVGIKLVHVRPARITPTDVFLIGVVSEIIDEVEYYSFACLSWKPESIEGWKKLGRLPFTITANDNFSVSLFGEGALVNALSEYLSPPPVLPQMPVGTYAKYAIGMP